MNFLSSLRTTAFGLAVSSVAFAQSPPLAPPTPPVDGAPSLPAGPSASAPNVTQSSRVRAFSAGPGGEVRSLYLQNGSIVELTPSLGGQLGAAVRKGEKITVTGTKSEINGQFMIAAASVRLNDRMFSADAPTATPPGPPALAEGVAPPPPGRRSKAAAPAPCGAPADAPPPPPDFGGPPPPPPDWMAPPPPPPQN